MKKMTIITAAILMVFFVASNAFAFGPWGEDHDKGGDKQHRHQRLVERLDLSEEQQDKLKEYREENKGTVKKLKEEQRKNRQALRHELKKSNVDRAAVNRTVGKMKDTSGELLDHKVDGFLYMKEVLTPKQFEELVDMKEDAKGKFRDGIKGRRERRRQ